MFKKVCVIGEGITSLLVTQMLLQLDLKVDLISESFYKKKNQNGRALAISQSNMKYLDELGFFKNKKNYRWNINGINLFNSKKNKDARKIFDFNNKIKPLFIIINSYYLQLAITEKLKNKSSLKIYSGDRAKNIVKKIVLEKDEHKITPYSLIFNCSNQNIINKKFFSNKIKKKYFTTAFTSTISHSFNDNNIASQFFMAQGPMAFLPLSNNKTSVVWSIYDKYLFDSKKINNDFFKNETKKIANHIYGEINFSEINEYNLDFLVSREYCHRNILNFGEGLHQIHPLVGQGFNMIVRDVKVLNEILKNNIDLGLELTPILLSKFSEITKSYNFLFANSVDIVEKYFSTNNELLLKLSDEIVKNLNKNSFVKNFLVSIADKGINRLNY